MKCPTCQSRVSLVTGEDGSQHYAPHPEKPADEVVAEMRLKLEAATATIFQQRQRLKTLQDEYSALKVRLESMKVKVSRASQTVAGISLRERNEKGNAKKFQRDYAQLEAEAAEMRALIETATGQPYEGSGGRDLLERYRRLRERFDALREERHREAVNV